MKRKKRMVSLILAVLMLTATLPPVTLAAPVVCFTAVNDTICDLNDATMPFWSKGVLYVPHTAIDDGSSNKELGIYCAYNREKKLVTLYRQRQVLVFDTAKGTAYDNENPSALLGGEAIVRGDVAFLPLGTVTEFFSLEYSYLKVSYGNLVRIKSDTVVLSDSKFVDAATSFMENRYKQYEKTHGGGFGTLNNGEAVAGTPVYLTVSVDSFDAAGYVLQAITSVGGAATFVFDGSALVGNDDLLRRIVISGSVVALRVDASRGAEQAIFAIERANHQLWTASNTKTRLVCLSNASDATAAAVRAAGYCPVTFALDYREGLPSASLAAGSILSLAGKKQTCSVLLGGAAQAENLIASLASSLRAQGCALARLNEVVA